MEDGNGDMSYKEASYCTYRNISVGLSHGIEHGSSPSLNSWSPL